ncbi:MAG TPA: MarR family transcriptional regulator [Alphaproteobacteria bacterium]
MPNTLTSDDALRLWRTAIVDLVRADRPDLSMRQMAILVTVYTAPPPHTVRGLARRLNIAKPAVTRALDRLCRLELVQRRRDDRDRRNVLVQRTVAGTMYLSDLADMLTAAASGAQPGALTAA